MADNAWSEAPADERLLEEMDDITQASGCGLPNAPNCCRELLLPWVKAQINDAVTAERARAERLRAAPVEISNMEGR